MADNDNRYKLWQTISKEYDLPDYNQFSKDMEDATKRKSLHDAVSAEYDLPDFDQFSKDMGYEAQTTQQGNQNAQNAKNPQQTAQSSHVEEGRGLSSDNGYSKQKTAFDKAAEQAWNKLAHKGGIKWTIKGHPEVKMVAVTDDLVKRFPQLEQSRGYQVPFNMSTGTPIMQNIDDKGNIITPDEASEQYTKILTNQDFDYVPKQETAAVQIGSVVNTALSTKGGWLDRAVQKAMEESYGKDWKNRKYVSDGKEISSSEIYAKAKQGIYDNINGVLGDIRKSLLFSTDEQRRQTVDELYQKGYLKEDFLPKANALHYISNVDKDEQVEEIRQRILKLQVQREMVMDKLNQIPQPDHAENMAEFYARRANDGSELYASDLRKIDKQIAQYKAVIDELEGKNNLKNEWGHAVQTSGITDIGAWDFGVTDLKDAMMMYPLAKKMQNGENITQDDFMSLKLLAQANEADAVENAVMPSSYNMFKGSLQSVPFTVQFGAGKTFAEGTASVVNKAATRAVKGAILKAGGKKALRAAEKVAEKAADSKILKFCGMLGKDFEKAFVMENTTSAATTGAEILNRHIGTVTESDDGFKMEGESLPTAIIKGEISQNIESQTEFLGEHFPSSLKFIRGMAHTKVGSAMGLRNLAAWLTKVSRTEFATTLKSYATRAGINGVFGEYLEEVAGTAENALLVGDQKFSDLLDVKQQEEVAGSVVLSCLGMGIFGTAIYSGQRGLNMPTYYRLQHLQNKWDNAGLDLFTGEEWAKWKDRIDNTPNEGMKFVMADILKADNMTEEQARAAFNYARCTLTLRGMNIGAMKAAQLGLTDDRHIEQDNAYVEGRQAKDEDKHDIQIEFEDRSHELAEKLGISEQQLDNMSDEELESLTGKDDQLDNLIYDYQTSHAKYQGVVDNADDEIDKAAQEAARQADMATDKSRGTVRNATIKAAKGEEDYGVYIVSGNVATNEDGSINVSESDDMILYYDPKSGKIEHCDAMRLAALGEEVNAEDTRNQAIADAKEKAIRKQAGIIDGTVGEGTSFTITDAEGNEHTYEVLADNGDGSAMITMDGNVQDTPVSLQDLQNLKDAEEAKRLEAAKMQRQQYEEEREKQNAPVEDNLDYADIINTNGNVEIAEVVDEEGNAMFPDAEEVFFIQNQGDRAKVMVLDNEGNLQPKLVKKSSVRTLGTMSVDEYRQGRQQTLKEAENESEPSLVDETETSNNVVPTDNVTTDNTTTDETQPGNEAEVTTSNETQNISNEQENTPKITLEDGTEVPMLEDGNPDFSQLTAEQVAELYDSQFGDDAEQIVSGNVNKAKKALDKANGMTVSGGSFAEQKASKKAKDNAIAEAKEKYDSAKAIADAYNERMLAKEEDTPEGRMNLIEKARRKFNRMKGSVKDNAQAIAQLYDETVGSLLHRLYDSTGIDVFDDTANTVDEYVASSIAPYSLNYEGTETSKGVKQETGLSRSDFAKTGLLAKEGKGKTIGQLANDLWRDRPSNLENITDQDVRNAIIDLITSGQTAFGLKNHIQNLRIAEAENILEQQKRQADELAHAEKQKEEELASTEQADNNTEDSSNADVAPAEEQAEDNKSDLPFDAPSPDENSPFSAKDKAKDPLEVWNNMTDEEKAAYIENNRVKDTRLVDDVVGKKLRKAIEKIAEMMGATIQWQRTDMIRNGWFNPNTKTIYLALDSSILEGVQFVFGHEMTHDIKTKSPAMYDELKGLVKEKYGEELFEAKTNDNEKRYAGVGKTDNDRSYYEEETVADAIGKMINDLNLTHSLALKMSHPLLAKIHDVLLKIKNAFKETPYKESMNGIIRTIEQVYVKTANGTFESSASEGTNDDENVSYSLRQKPEPEKKGTGYKVFVLGKDGKLYPPMVANPNGAATPVGVWLDADAAPVAGESKTGRPQVKQGGKGTQGGSGKLAYRPGWHLGVIPYAIQFNRKDAEGNKTLFPKNFVFAEVEYAADKDYQDEAHAEGINNNGKYQHSLAGLKHLPTDGYYMYRTNPNPETDPWVITGAMKMNRLLTRAEQADIVRKAGREPQQIQEGDIVTDDVVNSINQEIAAAPKFSLKVYHGSGADFTEFDFDHMGEGVGSQAFGWGGYVTSSKDIGKSYANIARHKPTYVYDGKEMSADDFHDSILGEIGNSNEHMLNDFIFNLEQYGVTKAKDILKKGDLARYKDLFKQSLGDTREYADNKINAAQTLLALKGVRIKKHKSSFYEVNIPDDNGSNYLDWYGKNSEIPQQMLDNLTMELEKIGWKRKDLPSMIRFTDSYDNIVINPNATGADLYEELEEAFKSPKEASEILSKAGFVGAKYPAGTIMGGAKEGDVNYVIFKPEDMQIVEHEKFSVKRNTEEAKEFHGIIDEMFKDGFDKSKHLRERYDLGETPTWMKTIGIKGDNFSLSFKCIKIHKGKDSDHDLTKEEWHELPDAIKMPFAVTRYQGANDRFRLYVNINHNGKPVAVGIDVKRINQGKGKPQLDVNSIKTVFAHHGEIGGTEVLVTYDENITPQQQALLRGLNFHEYPTIQELSAANVGNSSETSKQNGDKFSLRLQNAIDETDTEPTEAQKKSGNYKKGHVKFGGYDYTIENPKGSYRSGVDENGKEWKQKMNDTYGYIRGKFGKDGDHLDMFINDRADLDSWNDDVYVVDQVKPDGKFDEHKVMYGYDSLDDAKKAYLSNYEKGWTGLGNITPVSKADFDKWLDRSNRKLKPFADYADITSKTDIDTAPSSFEEFLDVVRYSIRNEKERAAAEDAYNFAQENRPDRYSRYAIVNMEKPGAVPQYLEKKTVADNWRRYYNKLKWGNYKLFDLGKPFEDNVKNLVGKFPETFRQGNDERFSLIGKKGAEALDHAEEVSTRLDNLNVARQMEGAKKDAKAIKMATGWERGADGKWRYEIADSKLNDMMDVDGKGKMVKRHKEDMLWTSGKLGEVVVAPELFKAYPKLKDVRLETDSIMNNLPSNGEYNAKTNTITIHADELKYLDSILNHEIQHVIQDLEGFAQGGDSKHIRKVLERMINENQEASDYAKDKLKEWVTLTMAADRLSDLYKQYINSDNEWLKNKAIESYWDAMNELDNNEQSTLTNDYPDGTAREIAESGYHVDEAEKELRRLAKETKESIPEGNNSALDLVSKLTDALENNDDYNLYRKLGGEVEARNVQSRMGMSPEERRKTLAEETEDVARKDQIFLYGGSVSMMGSRAFNEAINSSDNIRFSLKEEKEKIVSDAKANGTYMTAPNGEKTKLNAEQWVTVRTTNFKNWFGNWENDPENASKVVDENGEPMVVWHGRSAEFNTFEKKEGVRFIMGLEDKVKAEGFFFSPNKGLAEEFASNSSRHRGGKANVIPCFLNIRKPMDLTKEDYDRIYEDVTGWDYIVGMDTQDNLWGIMDEEGMADKIKGKGYDGVIFVEEVDDSYEPTKISYCALDANQIKSAENNNGDFSADNNDIRFSLKSMMEKPEGWKQANKKAIHIAEAIERDPKFSLKNLDGTLIKAGTYFSGGGLVEEGLKGIIDPVVAVEYDEKISGVYRNNFGDHIVTADVRDVDPKELVDKIDGDVEYFHASPVCKNYSLAKNNHEELELDKETAASTAEFISKVRPKVVTIENVKGYKDSEAMKTITDALDEAGYKWDADVYNAADYGGYTNRERLIVRAVRDGELPAKPEKQKRKSGWYEAVEDIIPTLTEKKNGVAPWMDERLKADGIDWRHIDKPLYVMGSGYANGTVPHAFADELLPTLRTKSGDVIVMPDGKVYRAMGRVLARVSGVSDDYQMPASEALSHTIIGNGIPTQLTENVIAPLVRDVLHPAVEEKASLKDAEYLEAVRSGDMEKAQKMVYDAARAAGYVNGTEYQGEGSWNAPSASVEKKDFANLDALRESVEEYSGDTNVYGIINGVTTNDDDFYYNPGRVGFRDAAASETSSVLRRLRYDKADANTKVKVYRTVPTDVKGNNLMSGDWIALSKQYCIEHGNGRYGEGGYRIIEEEVPIKTIWNDGNDMREFGFDDGNNNEAEKNVPNNRKLLDAVTYDNNGNVIPLSERFNESNDDIRYSLKNKDRKQAQLDIILKTNPMLDDYHTGIRKVEDIKTLGESVEEARSEAEKYGDDEWSAYPDITNDMLQNALETGEITIYSSKPIKNGVFVTPSYMQASDYAGGGNVYEKTVPLTDVAWINTDEGQYAKVDGERYSLKEVNDKFNDRLAQLIENPNQKDRVLHLGRSSQFLIDGGIADAEIELDFDKFVRKSSEKYKNNHPFSAGDIKDLPKAIAHPVAVFNSTTKKDHVVMTELNHDGKNFIVAIRATEQNRKNKVVLEVNQITSLYPKGERGIIYWINNNKLSNVDKEKALQFIEALQPHAGTLTSEELSSAANIVRNFVNPKQNDGNLQKTEKYSLRVDRYRDELNQWKKDNNLPKDAERPQLPVREPNESAADFLKRVKEYRKQAALWATAPTYEDHLLTSDTAQGQFNLEMQRKAVLTRIVVQDSMLAIRKAQEAIMKEHGVDKLNPAEDAYTAENRSHGKAKNEFEEYNDEFLQPLRKAYNELMLRLGKSYDNVKVYMIAKHGLERNAHIAFKYALDEDYETNEERMDAYNNYKSDMDRLNNDADFEAGRIDFATWKQRDGNIRTKYAPSYFKFRFDENGITKDYSGLSALFDADDYEGAAADLVKDVEDANPYFTDELWYATNDATKKILRDSYNAGMMTEDNFNFVSGMYRNYIPLRGWGDTNADQVWNYVGGGKGAFNQVVKEAKGRKSLADDPIAYIENMAESAILMNNRNWVKQHLLLLAQNHRTSLLNVSKAWYIKTKDAQGNEEWIPASPQITEGMTGKQVEAALEAFEQKMEQMKQNGEATQKREHLEISYPQTNGEEREHEVRVMKGGEEFVIYVNGDPQLAQAMNNTRARKVREGLESSLSAKVIARTGRYIAAAYTSRNPLFTPANFFRDLSMALASTAIREDARYNYLLRWNMLTHWNTFPMVLSYQNGTLRKKVRNGSASRVEQMFYDFMMNGGETGFVTSVDVEDLKKKFRSDLKDLNRMAANPKKVGHIIMDSIETLNRAIEDSNRFMVYMTSIQYGRSIEEAVNNAKDVTLNFNRKGTGEHWMQNIRNLYLFINPAIQSLQTLGALAKHHPFKFTAVTTGWLATGLLASMLNNLLMSFFGGDDDKDKYWQFTKWNRRNNFIMWVPFTKEFVKIPLAQEFRGFYGVGDMIASKLWGGEKAEESWSDYAVDLMGQIVDMLPLDPTGYDGNVLIALMPNVFRPIFELGDNVDFTGKPIFRNSEYNKYDPNFTKAYVGTPDWLVRISKMVNSIDNKYPDVQQNAIDRFGDPRFNLNNPAVVDHVLSSYLGGAYTMGSQILGVATKALNGDDIKMADIPLASKFVSNPDDRPVSKKQGEEFWDMKERHDRASNTLSKLKQKAKVDGDYSTLDIFFGSDEYRQYKEDDKKVKKYEEDRKKEKAQETGEAYRPHKTTADDVYKSHTTPKDDFEDMKMKQLYEKLNSYKIRYEAIDGISGERGDAYYKANKAAIDAIEEIAYDKSQIASIKKGFLSDGQNTYDADGMKDIRELRKRILDVLEKANKVMLNNRK